MGSKFNSILFSLSIFFIFAVQKSSAECERTGVICSADCTKIVLCTAPGAPEITVSECDLVNDGYCEEDESTGQPTCTADDAQCAIGSQKIICGAYGEFPHPTICGRSVQCNALDEEPIQDCYCNNNLVIDYTQISLPCVNAFENSECPTSCDDNPMQIGPYCYACTEDGIYAYICGGAKNGLNNTQLDVKAPGDKTCAEHTTAAPSTSSPTTTTQP